MTTGKTRKLKKPRYDVCKPCWELKYCPYGPLVEQFPLPYSGRSSASMESIEEKYHSYLSDSAEGRYKSEDEILRMVEILLFYRPWAWESIEGYDTSEMECFAFGHVCPVFFMAESETETKETRRRGRYIPRGIMLKVVRRDGQICQDCGKHVLDQELEFDHIIPHSKGGPCPLTTSGSFVARATRKRATRWPSSYESSQRNHLSRV
jgi:hypothetical protein